MLKLTLWILDVALAIERRLFPGSARKEPCPRCPAHLDRLDRSRWEVNRWSALSVLQDSIRNRWDKNFVGGTRWPEMFPRPRTCSGCGCIHPDDAMALLADFGWEVEHSSKHYKAYLHPPGYHAYMATIREAVGRRAWPTPDHVDPIPPVKVYAQHFTRGQLKDLNAYAELSRLSGEPS